MWQASDVFLLVCMRDPLLLLESLRQWRGADRSVPAAAPPPPPPPPLLQVRL